METEMKFKLTRFNPENYLIHKKTLMTQIYLNCESDDNKTKIESYFESNLINWSTIKEVRIRDKIPDFYLTLKSDGDLIRNEYEIKIKETDYESLKGLTNLGLIQKIRYEIIVLNDLLIEVDEYVCPEHIKGLLIAEVEFNENDYDQETIINIVSTTLGDDIENVTFNKSYKNINLI
jgi:CYTH domain-containing protein